MKSSYKKYFLIMILCFLLGGFSIITYVLQAYSTNLDRGFFGPRALRIENSSNLSDLRSRALNFTGTTSASLLFSPFALMLLFSGILMIIAGGSIWSITREKEIKHTRERITNLLLLPEERSVIDELKKAGGSVTQSQLVLKTGIGKVKIHRVVKSLERKGIINKYQYGLTNKIVLEKNIE